MGDAKQIIGRVGWYSLTSQEERKMVYGELSEDDMPLKTEHDKNKEFVARKKAILFGYGKNNAIGGVYCITQKDTDRFYIGSSVDINSRIELHFLELEYGKHHSYKLQDDWLKYGKDSFITEIIWEAPKHTDKNIILSIEQDYLDKHQPFYNIKKTVDYIKPRVIIRRKKKVKKTKRKGEKPKNRWFNKNHEIFDRFIVPELNNYNIEVLIKGKYKISNGNNFIIFASKSGQFYNSQTSKWKSVEKNQKKIIQIIKKILK